MSMDETVSSRRFEDYAYVLDHLPQGKPEISRTVYRAESIVQVVGEIYFTLLEATVKLGVSIKPRERIYVGKGPYRDKVSRILGRIKYDDLTSTAKSELIFAIEDVVKNQEARFIECFNTMQAITPRMHALELIPGVGKKYMQSILRQRELKPFTTFDDLRDRANIPDPVKLVAKRILEELTETSKYRIFVRSV